MPRINRKLIDVDFENQPFERGALDETDREIEQSLYGSVEVLDFATDCKSLMMTKDKRRKMAEKTWPKLKKMRGPAKAQKRTSACVGFACAKALENAMVRLHGHGIETSGMKTYQAIGRSLMSGAMPSDGLKEISNIGCLPLDTTANRSRFDLCWGNEASDYSKRPPAGWQSKTVARVQTYAVARGEDAIESAMAQGLPGVYGRARHAISPMGLAIDSGKPFVPYDNSWGAGWGDGGIGYDSYSVYRNLYIYILLEITVTKVLVLPQL